jgi:hypothetical protein
MRWSHGIRVAADIRMWLRPRTGALPSNRYASVSVLHGMKLFLAVLALGSVALTAPALTATNLAGFEGIEEPDVKYIVADRKFVPDDFTNITDVGSNTVRMTLRYHAGDWWDGDRERNDTSRQRAEVKGIGPHQRPGETFEYATTWRTSANFFGSGGFCHVFQLKAIDGNNGAPLVTLSILAGTSNACVHYWSGNSGGFTDVRRFNWSPGIWENVRIRIRPSSQSTGTKDGAISVSVNGDDFLGVTNVAVYRPDATSYRPKWGLYRGTGRNLPPGDSYVEHKDASARPM